MSFRKLLSSTISGATLVLVAALFIASCVSGGGYGSGSTASGGGGNGCQAGYCNSNGYCCPSGECGCNGYCYSGSGYLSAGCTTCKTVC